MPTNGRRHSGPRFWRFCFPLRSGLETTSGRKIPPCLSNASLHCPLLPRPCNVVDFSFGGALQHFTNEVQVVLNGPVAEFPPVPSQGMNHIGGSSQPLDPCERSRARRLVERRLFFLRRILSFSRAIPVGRAAPRASTRNFSETAAQPGMATPEADQRQCGFHGGQYIGMPTFWQAGTVNRNHSAAPFGSSEKSVGKFRFGQLAK